MSRRQSSFDAARLRRLKRKRETSKDDLLESIPKAVGTDPIPTRLSRETIVEAIVTLERTDVARRMSGPMNETQLRKWLAELCGFRFNPNDDRALSYRTDELEQIDQTLERADR